jgi:hypothetical protein
MLDDNPSLGRYHFFQPLGGKMLEDWLSPGNGASRQFPAANSRGPGGFIKSRPPPRLIGASRRKGPRTFADIRRNAEKRLKLGLKLDFDQIMADIAALRTRHRIPQHH